MLHVLIPTTDDITLDPVESTNSLYALREFKHILQSSIGPRGSPKLLVNGGGHMELTSTSSTIIQRLDLHNPVCRYIAQVVASQPDFGLQTGVLLLSLLDYNWSQHNRLSPQSISQSIQILFQHCQKLLNSVEAVIDIDFGSLSCLLPVVKSVITPKLSALSINIDISKLCVQIIKAFILCTDCETNTIGRILIKAECGEEELSCYSGILYEITEHSDLKIIKQCSLSSQKLLVFTVMLEDTVKENEVIYITTLVMPILEAAILSGVRVVVCQKVIDDSIKLFLRRKSVIVLERMGRDQTAALLTLSGAFPISDITKFTTASKIDQMFGTISAKHLLIGNVDYILLESTTVGFVTLLVHSPSLAGAQELKTIAQQAVNSLRALARHPKVTPGAGCLEVWLVIQLHLLLVSRESMEISPIVINWLQRSLLSTCGMDKPEFVDTVQHHGWRDYNKCMCGLVSKPIIEEAGGDWLPLDYCNPPLVPNMIRSDVHQPLSLNSDAVVDSHFNKRNSVMIALETFINLLDIGAVMYTK